VPEPYPLRAPRPTLRAEGGLPCSRRLGRSRVRHRRDPGRAARATLVSVRRLVPGGIEPRLTTIRTASGEVAGSRVPGT
jgi:hypothetical protein